VNDASFRQRLWPQVLTVVALGARVLALLALCLLAWAAVPRLAGWIPTTVASGSMEPRILTGDVVVSMPIDGTDVGSGQVVLVDDPATDGSLLLHRLVERESGGLRLQGDANRQPDRLLVDDAAVRGVGVLRVPFIGLPIVWARAGDWLPLVLAGLFAVAVGSAVLGTRRLLGDDSAPRSPEGPLRAALPTAGVVLAAALAVSSVLPTAGASWAASTEAADNRLAAGTFSCFNAPFSSPLIDFDFNEPEGTAVINHGTGPWTASLGSAASRVAGGCGDSPFVRLDGSSGTQITTSPPAVAPSTFSLEAWFRTSEAQGQVLGFGNQQAAGSETSDRHVYIGSDGRLTFGILDASVHAVTTSESVADGAWHHVAVTSSPATGMALYLDGDLVGTDPAALTREMLGYWRIGFDEVPSDWPNAPTSPWFVGDLDTIAISYQVLSAVEAHDHAAAGRQ
jgi:signal peptidase I